MVTTAKSMNPKLTKIRSPNMGKVIVNNKEIVAPGKEIKVKELKDLANLPQNSKLYDEEGNILEDEQVVPAQDATYGAVSEWERGA